MSYDEADIFAACVGNWTWAKDRAKDKFRKKKKKK